MNDSDELDFTPSWFYYALIFTTILLWVILSVEIINMLFVLILSDPFTWFLLSGLLIFFYPVPIAILIWRMKLSVEIMDPQWHYEQRYVTFQEFREMITEYREKYMLFTSHISYRWIVITVIFIILLILSPYVLSYLPDTLFVLLLPIFGILMTLLGISYTVVLLAGLPGPLNEEFRIPSLSSFSRARNVVIEIPALSWIGIRLSIGEWKGYYTIHEPVIAAKIENLESATTVILDADSVGNIKSIHLSNDSVRSDFPSNLAKSYPTPSDIIHILREYVHWYASSTKERELLDEIIDELDSDLRG